jgi:hypothetical protein
MSRERVYTMTLQSFNAQDCDLCNDLVRIGQRYRMSAKHREIVFGQRPRRVIAHDDCAAVAEQKLSNQAVRILKGHDNEKFNEAGNTRSGNDPDHAA